jgi:hypothetical protein
MNRKSATITHLAWICLQLTEQGWASQRPELDRIAALKSKYELPEVLAHDQLMGMNAFFGFGEANNKRVMSARPIDISCGNRGDSFLGAE